MSENLKQAVRLNLLTLSACIYTLSKTLDAFVSLLNEHGLTKDLDLANEISTELFKINKTLSDSKN